MTTESSASPPEIRAVIDQFAQALASVEGFPVDPLTAPWADIEKGVIKLLHGAFSLENREHATLAMMVSASWAERLTRDLGGFWFQNREAPEGAAMGFPEALLVVSPLDVTMQALMRAKLTLLDQVTSDVRSAIAQAKFAPTARSGAPERLGPAEYQQLFDPGFVQMVALDMRKARELWDTHPAAEARELESALSRLPARLPPELSRALAVQVKQLTAPLRTMDEDKTLGDQIARAPQLAELLTLLHAMTTGTGLAPEEMWQGIALPLLHVGTPETFVPLNAEEIDALKRGAEPVLLLLETVPFQFSVADEDGILGVFPAASAGLLDARFESARNVRLATLDARSLSEPLARFSAAGTRATVARFATQVTAQAGLAPDPEAKTPLLDAALALLEGLARTVEAAGESGVICMRHATQSEASMETAWHLIRQALNASRITLA